MFRLSWAVWRWALCHQANRLWNENVMDSHPPFRARLEPDISLVYFERVEQTSLHIWGCIRKCPENSSQTEKASIPDFNTLNPNVKLDSISHRSKSPCCVINFRRSITCLFPTLETLYSDEKSYSLDFSPANNATVLPIISQLISSPLRPSLSHPMRVRLQNKKKFRDLHTAASQSCLFHPSTPS